ncbi:MAG: FG-GAP-like repeat-containing protein [Flavobacteriaceae bacterium]
MKSTIYFFAFLISTVTFSQISFTTESITNSGQYSICAVDMNNDYLDDIVSLSSTNIQIFYQNPDNTFTEQNFTTTPAENMPSWSLAAGDLTGNGFNDLLYGGGSGVTFMMSNEDGTQYEQVSFPQYVFSQRTNFIDLNNDGHLDAFVCHDVAPNVYYINDGEGNLEFNQGGIGDFPTGGHYGSVWFDYNNDGLQDMFMAKCGGGIDRRTNQLFRNNGDGTFTDVAVEAGLDNPHQTWSAAAGDFDNDGFMDLMVGVSSFSDGGHAFMKNNGDGTFSDITPGSGFDIFSGTSVEHATYDFNNDGYLDIMGNSQTIYLNNGDMTFTPFIVPFSGASIADLNNDGFLDAFRAGNIHYNDGNDNNWIVINTQGVESNRNGIGARVEITSALGTQIRDVRSGEGFRYMSTLNTHFGIGSDTEIDELVIKWPSGIVDVITSPDINTAHLIIEGQTLGVDENRLTNISLSPNPATNLISINYSENLKGAAVAVYDVMGRTVLRNTLESNTFDVSNLNTGLYFLNLNLNGQTARLKFIKK